MTDPKNRKLEDLPKHMQTVRWIESEIAYESYMGVTTRHHCACGRTSCRASMCVQCWGELLEQAKEVERGSNA